MREVNYYPFIFRAVSRLPSNTAESRRRVYDQARAALAANANSRKERGALEWAIHAVETSPHVVPGARGSTLLLALSMFFAALWMQDATCMSVYWIVRPWNRNLWQGSEKEASDSYLSNAAFGSAISPVSPAVASASYGFGAKINKKRLTLSLSMAGALLVPLWTGSLTRFIAHPTWPAGIDYEAVHDPREPPEVFKAEIDCAISVELHHPEASACETADRLREQFPVTRVSYPYPASLNAYLAFPLLRDFIIGLIAPVFIVIVFPAAFQRYLRWLTS
jgi:hypothetical protein